VCMQFTLARKLREQRIISYCVSAASKVICDVVPAWALATPVRGVVHKRFFASLVLAWSPAKILMVESSSLLTITYFAGEVVEDVRVPGGIEFPRNMSNLTPRARKAYQ